MGGGLGGRSRKIFFAGGQEHIRKKDGLDKNFVRNFTTNFGEDPTYLSAQAFDAANIVIKHILMGVANRLKMKKSLESVRNFPGVTGMTTLLPSGDSEKNIFALTVKKNKIIQQN